MSGQILAESMRKVSRVSAASLTTRDRQLSSPEKMARRAGPRFLHGEEQSSHEDRPSGVSGARPVLVRYIDVIIAAYVVSAALLGIFLL